MKLLSLYISASFFRLYEQIRVSLRYYRRLSFLWVDFLLLLSYFFKSPHRVSKSFQKKRNAREIYVYGETPLTTLDYICRMCGLLSKDCIYDLGCGPGRTSFWLNAFLGCKVYAVDYLPAFIQKASRVKKWSLFSEIEFLEQDMLEANYTKATAVYLYGTCLEDSFIEKLTEAFKALPKGSKVITVSYPLTEYDPTGLFKVEKQFTGRFPWGRADIFLHIRQ